LKTALVGNTITGNTFTNVTGSKNMRVTTKGQVTIPQDIRKKLGIFPSVEVDFIEEKGRVYIVKKKGGNPDTQRFKNLRGIATVKMTTDQIMALTRG
jgi:AbrB family looped-hinge helix DNA binding protein